MHSRKMPKTQSGPFQTLSDCLSNFGQNKKKNENDLAYLGTVTFLEVKGTFRSNRVVQYFRVRSSRQRAWV